MSSLRSLGSIRIAAFLSPGRATTQTFGAIFLAVLLVFISFPLAAQERSSNFDDPAEIVLPQNYDSSRSYPVIAFPQATFGTSSRAAAYFDVRPHEQDEFIVILPAGTFTQDDYLPDFIKFVGWYEERLLQDIERARESYSIDPDRIYLGGFSLGGDLSWALSARNPDVFSGAIMSGTRASYPMTADARQTLKNRGFRGAFLIGEDEIPVRADGIRRAHQLLEGDDIETTFHAHVGEHSAPPRELGRESIEFITDGLTGAAVESSPADSHGTDRHSSESVANDSSGPFSVSDLTDDERELYEAINAYRAEHGLEAIPLSYSLTTVARAHVQDSNEHADTVFAGSCNLHSWSDQGDWSGCCYTSDHAQSQCMWNKPGELTDYPSHGYEISSRGYGSPERFLEGWKNSAGHNNVIINQSIWENSTWEAIGIGIDGSFAHVWFGRSADPAQGSPARAETETPDRGTPDRGTPTKGSSSKGKNQRKSAPQGEQPNWRATPTYETATLEVDFAPDPFRLPNSVDRIIANAHDTGEIFMSECDGYINMSAPDVNLDYQAGRYPLTIAAFDQSLETTLLIRTPDGTWVCSDGTDSIGPFVSFESPQSGTYNIWVGGLGYPHLRPGNAQVIFSEYEGRPAFYD